MTPSLLKPLVGVVSDIRRFAAHEYHVAGDKYLLALTQAADVVPVLIPALTLEHDIDQWLSRVDGVFLTGAYSMADPNLYGETAIDRPYEYDPRRDALSSAMIRGIRAADKPLFGICRGLQDINVALGGSLFQAVHEEQAMDDHREVADAELDVQYGPAHKVAITAGGLLDRILERSTLTVNSLHSQGIRRLAEDLQVEAVADDGLVEAVSIKGMRFGLGVQWHPEWRVLENRPQQQIFEAFGEACRSTVAKGNHEKY